MLVYQAGRAVMSWLIVLVFFFLKHASSEIHGEFSFSGYLEVGGVAEQDSSGFFKLTNSTRQQTGQIFYNHPLRFKNSTNGSVFSFSATFVFAIVSEYATLSGHGLAFVISPEEGTPGALASQFLGLFNESNNGNSSNHILAIELDTICSKEFNDINDNHVGIDINGLNSAASASAGFFTDDGGFRNLSLISRKPMQVWVEYDGLEKILNVTLHPIGIPKPNIPLLSLRRDISPYMYESMYVGFSSSTGSVLTDHYILACNFQINGPVPDIDPSRLPRIPGIKREGYKKLQIILATTLSLTGVTLILVAVFGAVLISKKKFMDILEDWEVQYGPHRFSYKDLFAATKGFKDKELLGKGGFGKVYKGTLRSSNTQIAVKRISHDSRQGMKEFVAEIATIGRLRHQNLVRLLGYCRRKNELLLVYDYMPNGSLDKFLYQPGNLSWSRRFTIIKNIASALFFLHQQWLQVVVHRDIKPANVLIDNDMSARLGDFGLAKLYDHGNDPQASLVAGTLGYIAPELARTGKATTSTDVYAFGMFMLEVACGRRPIEHRVTTPNEVFLVDWILECWERGAILEAVDSKLQGKYLAQEVELVLRLGLLCSHPVASARPSISSVAQFLDGVAPLPANLTSIIEARDFLRGSNEEDAATHVPGEKNSVPALTFSESFASHGR